MSYFDYIFPGKSEVVRNQTLNWSGTDTYENFQKYQPNPYTEDSITYKLNEYGFRSDNFVESEYRMIFLGCSVCEGLGLPIEETYSYIIHREIQKRIGQEFPYWNLGLGGCGIDSITRCYYNFHKILKPQVVIALFPPYRLEYLKTRTYWKSALFNLDSDKVFFKNPHLSDPNFISYNFEKNFAMLDLLLEENKSLFIWDIWDRKSFKNINTFKLKNFKNYAKCWEKLKKMDLHIPFARDGLHFGRQYHREFANFILNNYGDMIRDRLDKSVNNK